VMVRFQRCVDPANAAASSGPARADCPDPDERGYGGGAHGPLMSVCLNDRPYVKLVRDDIDNAAPLYVTSDTPARLEVISPAANAVLPGRAEMVIRLHAKTAGSAKLQVRYNRPSGDQSFIIHEMQVDVNESIRVPLSLHRTVIGGTGPDLAPLAGANIDWSRVNTLVTAANAVWRQYGIQFNVAHRRQSNYAGASAGNVNIGEWNALQGTDRTAHEINVHFVHTIDNGNTRGLGLSNAVAGTYGVCLCDDVDGNDMAHELGHVLRLITQAPAGGAGSGHADDDPDENNKRQDIWTRRRLMHSYNPHWIAGHPAYHRDVGYGNNVRGCMVSIKDLTNDVTDNELSIARPAAAPPLP